MVPLANQQVATMRRELEAEQVNQYFLFSMKAIDINQESRNQRASSPINGRSNTPQMGYAAAHCKNKEKILNI